MLTRRPLRCVTTQINSGAVFIRKPCGQRLKLRLRLCGGRLLPHPPEQFHSEIAQYPILGLVIQHRYRPPIRVAGSF